MSLSNHLSTSDVGMNCAANILHYNSSSEITFIIIGRRRKWKLGKVYKCCGNRGDMHHWLRAGMHSLRAGSVLYPALRIG